MLRSARILVAALAISSLASCASEALTVRFEGDPSELAQVNDGRLLTVDVVPITAGADIETPDAAAWFGVTQDGIAKRYEVDPRDYREVALRGGTWERSSVTFENGLQLTELHIYASFQTPDREKLLRSQFVAPEGTLTGESTRTIVVTIANDKLRVRTE